MYFCRDHKLFTMTTCVLFAKKIVNMVIRNILQSTTLISWYILAINSVLRTQPFLTIYGSNIMSNLKYIAEQNLRRSSSLKYASIIFFLRTYYIITRLTVTMMSLISRKEFGIVEHCTKTVF